MNDFGLNEEYGFLVSIICSIVENQASYIP